MVNNPSRVLFLFTLIFGSLISITSTSWLGAWAGLEINLLSFIPLMTDQETRFSSEAALKYFLTQALASAILLLGALLLLQLTHLHFTPPSGLSYIMLSSLFLKMGAAPFHFWFPGVMEGLHWLNGLILMTWQKIAPLLLASYLLNFNLFVLLIIISSAMAGALGGFNQTSLRKIMAFSSINHLGWMLSALLLGGVYWIMYFSFYVLLSASVVLVFHAHSVSHLNQIFLIPFPNQILKLALFCNFLSLGGLPPFLGFLPKWLILQSLALNGLILISSVLIMFSLVTLYFYLRMGYSAFLVTHSEPKWLSLSPPQPLNYITHTLSATSTFGLLVCSCFMIG
uniref:NADH-ubiquinone oxidoreductase chain 2 n=1 Tax=Isonychia kiangsinensis TaxID=1470551 RepID=A0A482FF21_9INSE|nr:NADH dehydrogenase subunit 2 [Isonychia kiangsinensis]QBO27424.1 NADH dehydrogenase subunit 2 [Isonychia kiangsinensis]